MSLFDNIKNKRKQSTRRFIGTKTMTDYGIENFENETLLYFIVEPTNLAVLSDSSISNKVTKLMVVLKEIADLEIICLNSRESFEDNKDFLLKRLEKEDDPAVLKILEKDINFLEGVQVQTASAREFLIVLKFLNAQETEIVQAVSRITKLLKEQEFRSRSASREDLKRVLAVYFVQNMTNVYYDDFNGENAVEKLKNQESAE